MHRPPCRSAACVGSGPRSIRDASNTAPSPSAATTSPADRPGLHGLTDAKGQVSGAGYWIMTPFALDGGGTVFVDRGFVPQDSARAIPR